MLAACTQEEPSFPTEGVEGAYPLQISSVTLAVEAGEEPWTRISESQDGQSSAWDWNGTGTLVINGLLSEGDYGLINNSYNTRITSLTLNDMERIEQSRLGNMVALQSITLPKAPTWELMPSETHQT